MNWGHYKSFYANHNLSSPFLSYVQYKQSYYWKQQIFLAKQFPPQAESLIALDVVSWQHGGAGKKKNDVRSGAELFLVSLISFHRAPVLKSSQRVLLVWLFCCTMWESGSKISSQLWLSLPYNWVPAAPMDQLIASAVYEIHPGLWQLAL